MTPGCDFSKTFQPIFTDATPCLVRFSSQKAAVVSPLSASVDTLNKSTIAPRPGVGPHARLQFFPSGNLFSFVWEWFEVWSNPVRLAPAIKSAIRIDSFFILSAPFSSGVMWLAENGASQLVQDSDRFDNECSHS